ncbi:MAG: lysophospholipid acyltransferase family protein [Deltaproteobacteria bacterium]|nr:lysophospholipid acyltransferase family protein [Deltaproteobacteria bacterium]
MMTIPTYVLLWVLLTALAPLWIPVMFLVGIFRRCSFVILRLLMFFWAYLATELVGLIVAAGIYLITPGDAERREDLFFRLECWWGNAMFEWLCLFLSLSTSIEGDEQILPGPVLVFIRHASIIDTLLPVALISNATGLQLRYVFKRELLIDPCLDVAGHASHYYFIDRGGSTDEELANIRKLGENLGERGVLLYPEGTRFTERKKRIAIERLAKAHPELVSLAESFQHCLPPKPGAALTLLDTAPDGSKFASGASAPPTFRRETTGCAGYSTGGNAWTISFTPPADVSVAANGAVHRASDWPVASQSSEAAVGSLG